MFSDFRKYLGFSILFHLAVALVLLFFFQGDQKLPPPRQQITMLRLEPRQGSFQGAKEKPAGEPKKGEPGPSAEPSPEPATPAKPTPKVVEKPQTPTPKAKPTKPTTPAAKPTVKPQPQGKTVAKKTAPTAQKPTKPAKTATPAPKTTPKKGVALTKTAGKKSSTTSTAAAKSKPSSAKPTSGTSGKPASSNTGDSGNVAAKPGPEDTQIAAALQQINDQVSDREKSTGSGGGGGGGGNAGAGGQGGQGAHEAGQGDPAGKITARDPGYAAYQSQVRSSIVRNWIQTNTGDAEQRLRARVLVRVNTAGQVIGKSFVKSSGNPSFDNSVLRAVERASPFPAPPDSVRDEALREGFIVDFSARVIGKK